MSFVFKWMDSPIGKLQLIATEKGLAGILWEKDEDYVERFAPLEEAASDPILLKAEKQLQQYFKGERKSFEVPLDFKGTPFQKKVWEALVRIPFGETRTYGEVAKAIGEPKAVRAVGGANNKNPVAIIAACHRVIGASGNLTGYRGGLDAKRHLLGIEGDSRFSQETGTALSSKAPRRNAAEASA